MSNEQDWEDRIAALPFERRATEADCPGCGSMTLNRGVNWIQCLPCHMKMYFEPDSPPTDSARIAAAVAVLEPGLHPIKCLRARLTDDNQQMADYVNDCICKALAILEGRADI